MRHSLWILLFFGLFFLGPSAQAAQVVQELHFGVFAYRPKPVMEERYRPLTDYLTARLDGVKVSLHILELEEMEEALAQQRLDLIMTNPSHYMIIRSNNHLTGALATLTSYENNLATASLGGVIITRAERSDINTLADLKGLRIAAPGTKYLGGFQTQALELMDAGVALPVDEQLVITGRHDNVVDAVLAGEVDAGFIRTGILERLAEEKGLDRQRLKVINPQPLTGFPYAVSTRLYPEWPFIALPSVDICIAREIMLALFELTREHPAAQAAKIAGFTTAADYQSIEFLARRLRTPPYDQVPEFTWHDIVDRHQATIISGLVGLLFAALLMVLLMLRNRRLKQLSQKLTTAQLRLEEKNQEMEQFVYAVSHDLKSPMVTIKSFVGLLRNDISSQKADQIANDLEFITAATTKMEKLLTALLKLARVGNSQSEVCKDSVENIVNDTLSTLAGSIQDHKIDTVVTPMPQRVRGDLLRIGQIWQNLIENAVKYRGDQSAPRIEIGVTQQDKETVFFVRDNGMGIEPAQNRRIFQLFSQLNHGSDGVGLGLALVKKIVDSYDGRIWVESEGQGKGSCFMFTLPGALVKDDKAK